MNHKFECKQIGLIKTPFKQKLSIPRQPLLVPQARGEIILEKNIAREDTLRMLDTFTHLWLMYWCHKSESWRESIRAPRLGGKKKVGFLASRSPHRPNPIGLSVVKLEEITIDHRLIVSGLDILDETPLLDIKPYLPMWDSIENATNGWVDNTAPLTCMEVEISQECKEMMPPLSEYELKVLTQSLSWDPRPVYAKSDNRSFIHTLFNYEITWKSLNKKIVIESIVRI